MWMYRAPSPYILTESLSAKFALSDKFGGFPLMLVLSPNDCRLILGTRIPTLLKRLPGCLTGTPSLIISRPVLWPTRLARSVQRLWTSCVCPSIKMPPSKPCRCSRGRPAEPQSRKTPRYHQSFPTTTYAFPSFPIMSQTRQTISCPREIFLCRKYTSLARYFKYFEETWCNIKLSPQRPLPKAEILPCLNSSQGWEMWFLAD